MVRAFRFDDNKPRLPAKRLSGIVSWWQHRTLAVAERRIAGLSVEVGVFFAPDGKLISAWEGQADYILYPATDTFASSIKNTIHTHNHPTGESCDEAFSESDLRFACMFGLHEMRVVRDDYVYTLHPGQALWTPDSFEKNWIPLLRAVDHEVMESRDFPSLTDFAEFNHLVYQRFSVESGMIYQKVKRK